MATNPTTPSQTADGSAQPPHDQHPTPSHGSGLTLEHLRGMVRNEPVGIVVISSCGWIIATIIAIAKFMAKLTGSHLVIHNSDHAPPQ